MRHLSERRIMKKLLLLIVVTVALATPVSAQAATTTESIPFDADVVICNGDVVHLSGTLLAVFTETATPSGGFVVSAHFQPQRVSGVDLVTGTRFIATGLTRDILVVAPRGGLTETFVNQFHIQATTGEQSFIVSEVFHITIAPDGTITAFVDNFRATC
jgi:hypothetical protein